MELEDKKKNVCKRGHIYSQVNFQPPLMNKRIDCMAFGLDVIVLLASPEFFM